MKRRSILWIALAVLAFILLTAAVSTAGDLVRFKVDNQTDGEVYIQLTGGPRRYYLRHVAAREYIWTIMNAEYDYTLYACGGAAESGTVDLTRHQTWVVPPCGDKAFTTNSGDGSKDVGRELRMVRLALTNKTSQSYLIVAVYDDNGSLWVFTLPKGEAQHYTVPKGKYSYTAYGCGGSWTGTIYANHPRDNSFSFKCP